MKSRRHHGTQGRLGAERKKIRRRTGEREEGRKAEEGGFLNESDI
jgi:hypothetical protein